MREATGNGIERTVLNASGYVTARRQATVSSKVTGKVTEVLVEEGMKVQEGQVLARLDDTNVKTSLRLAEAQLVSATNALAETRVRIREAEQELERQTGLVKNKIATQADYDHAEAAVLALKAQTGAAAGRRDGGRKAGGLLGAAVGRHRSSARRSPASSPRRTRSRAR